MYTEKVMTVLQILYEDEVVQQLKTDGGNRRALLYKQMTSRAKVGSTIIVNTTASTLRLGTGGWDIVRYVHPSSHFSSQHIQTGSSGHIMKARYTPIQHSVMTLEEEGSPDHSFFNEPFTLQQPVILAELHSMVPIIYYVAQQLRAGISCYVIFDDQASLSLLVSEHVRSLQKEKYFTSITVGQSFGGMYEAVNVASALQWAAGKKRADLLIVSVGPGVIGTGTTYGFSSLALSSWSHIVSGLGGLPVWVPRLSFFDERKRHYGISHHTLTALAQFTFQQAIIPLPFLSKQKRAYVKMQLKQKKWRCAHTFCFAKENHIAPIVQRALTQSPLPIQSMGRTYADDPHFFHAVAETVSLCLHVGP